jgi:two-component system cell cycle sensor histidine kinase/response regulator CckA
MSPSVQDPDVRVEILIVEDSPTQSAKLQFLLEAEGYEVTVADNGAHALALLQTRKPTLLITDVMMPEMDGFTLCKQIKSTEALRDLPVILMTSLSSPRDILRGLECGADNFIRKPYDDHNLLSRIKAILLNRTLRNTKRAELGVDIYFLGQRYRVTSERQQILDLLISTYEDAVNLNEELQVKQAQLSELAQELEKKVESRTIGLRAEIADRRRAEERLRESEERYRDLFENANDLIWSYTMDGVILYANRAWKEALGYSDGDIQNLNVEQIIHPDGRSIWVEQIKRLFRSESENKADVVLVTKSGKKILGEASRSCKLVEGKPAIVRSIIRDVTDRRHLEEQLFQTAKMEAIGKLAGGVAHDFNNLLTVICGYGELLRESVEGEEQDYAAEILKATASAAALTRQLLAFSRRQIIAPQVLDLNSVVVRMEKMLKRLIGERIELLTLRDSNLGRVKADPGQVEQIIMNLAVNARDAMPQGGKLTIETANVDLDSAYIRSHSAVPGPYILLAVSDTGVGMDADTLTHVFEPFFTTKEKGKGTGLGLSTVYGIVKQNGGNIWVYSERGRGSTFKVYLPRVYESAEEAASRTSSSESLNGTETILLAEDEEGVRSLVYRTLHACGYRVLVAKDVEDAVNIFEDCHEPIHLLLTDVVMPQMNGNELAKRLSIRHPETEVLYMSGYTDNAIVHHGVLEAGTFFIQKPFMPKVLMKKVREVLDARTKIPGSIPPIV